MYNLLLSVDVASIDWSRAQFALTAIYHWLFVPLTLGLALIMGIMETCYYKSGKPFWKDVAVFWQKLFGINFAMGVATGIILEFEFGTNWSNYSWFVGDIFGAPLAIEGIVAFFMESVFVAVMFFGWNKVSGGFHLASTWLTGLGATISAWWILVANAWMQCPVGCEFNPDTVRNEMVSFMDVALSPFAVDKFIHTAISSWIIGAIFVVAVSSWYLLKKREEKLAKASIKIASVTGLAATVLALGSGDSSAVRIAKVQPMKLAAMEALYEGGNGVGLTAFALVNPFEQPDYKAREQHPLHVNIPKGLSVLATHNPDAYVPGVNNILRGYVGNDGVPVPSVKERMESGKKAIKALSDYRQLKGKGNTSPEITASSEKILKDNISNFGYGYLNNENDVVPYIPVCFYAFRIMVGVGTLLILFFAILTFMAFRTELKGKKWLLMAGIIMLPLGYIASEAGWILAEFGRQPWAIQDMLPTRAAVSDISASSVATTFFIFLALFTTLLVVEISIMCKQIKKGPEYSS